MPLLHVKYQLDQSYFNGEWHSGDFEPMRFPYWVENTENHYLPDKLHDALVNIITGMSNKECIVVFKAEFFQMTHVKGFHTDWKVDAILSGIGEDEEFVYLDKLTPPSNEQRELPIMTPLPNPVTVKSLEIRMKWRLGQISPYFEFIGCETGRAHAVSLGVDRMG